MSRAALKRSPLKGKTSESSTENYMKAVMFSLWDRETVPCLLLLKCELISCLCWKIKNTNKYLMPPLSCSPAAGIALALHLAGRWCYVVYLTWACAQQWECHIVAAAWPHRHCVHLVFVGARSPSTDHCTWQWAGITGQILCWWKWVQLLLTSVEWGLFTSLCSSGPKEASGAYWFTPPGDVAHIHFSRVLLIYTS